MIKSFLHSCIESIPFFTKKSVVSTHSVEERTFYYPFIGLVVSVYSLIPILLYKIFFSPYLFSSDHLFLLALSYMAINSYISKASAWQELLETVQLRNECKAERKRNPKAFPFLIPLFAVLFYIGGLMQMLKYGLIDVIFFTPIFSKGTSAIVNHFLEKNYALPKKYTYRYIDTSFIVIIIFVLAYYILPMKYILLMILAFFISFAYIILLIKQHPILKNNLRNIHILLTEILIFLLIAL
ncbi:MAG: hypothetical protein ACRCV3_04405 [Desulfovibrionaceae bacterium]